MVNGLQIIDQLDAGYDCFVRRGQMPVRGYSAYTCLMWLSWQEAAIHSINN